MGRDDRKHERHETVLEVRFSVAEDFVVEYAENLSAGGLFVRQAHNLEPMTHVQVQLSLPGYRSFEVTAQVAHVLDEPTAARFHRRPGAGLQLVEVPEGFESALAGYLGRLGRRRDSLILVDDPACHSRLQAAGFRVELCELGRVVDVAIGSPDLIAVVVGKTEAAAYREALSAAPRSVPVIGAHIAQDEEPLLVELDRIAAAR